MMTQDDIDGVIALCDTLAKQAATARREMSTPPDDPAALALWRVERARLANQIDSLGAMVIHLTAAGVLIGLEDAEGDLARLGAATARARASIEAINSVGQLLTRITAVLTLATAMLTVATAPTPQNIAGLIAAIDAL